MSRAVYVRSVFCHAFLCRAAIINQRFNNPLPSPDVINLCLAFNEHARYNYTQTFGNWHTDPSNIRWIGIKFLYIIIYALVQILILHSRVWVYIFHICRLALKRKKKCFANRAFELKLPRCNIFHAHYASCYRVDALIIAGNPLADVDPASSPAKGLNYSRGTTDDGNSAYST